MPDYRVAPQALRANVNLLYAAADAWNAAHAALNGKDLAEADLGMLGHAQEVVRSHNDTLVAVLVALRDGAQSLQQAGDSLNQVAKVYEAMDAEHYQAFGHLG